jgi:dTDP-glucose 4,6-dehydratase
MRLLVTGGAGFIGSNFVRKLINDSGQKISSITIIDNLTYAGSVENLSGLDKDTFEFIKGDICDEQLILQTTKTKDIVVNFAAESHVDRSINSASEFVNTNILGTQVLLNSMKKHDNGIFIQVSTDEVYGSIDFGSSFEGDKLCPSSPYSASKASADLLAYSYYKTFELDIRITRASNNYGRNQYPEKLIPLAITNILLGKKIPIYGDGSNSRDWIHVDDHVQGILEVIRHGTPGSIYNLGGNNVMSNLQIIEMLLAYMNADENQIEFVADRLGHDFRYSLNTTKAEKEIGFRNSIPFQVGLKETIDWYVTNRVWWEGRVKV